MAAGLLQLDASITATNEAVLVGVAHSTVWVAVNGLTRDAERASDFLIGRQGDSRAVYVGNAPEVALEIIRGLSTPPAPIPAPCEILQVGFPGIPASDLTYVGSWQWHIHGEARDDEYVRRAANATLNAIQAKESKDTGRYRRNPCQIACDAGHHVSRLVGCACDIGDHFDPGDANVS